VDAIRRYSKPVLRKPVAIVAFEGWSDACEAASGAVGHLHGRFDAGEPFAALEPEEFYDFQEHRPIVRIDDGAVQAMTWPELQFYGVERPDAERDLVLVSGSEPSFRWKTFARSLTQVLTECGVDSVVVLGAYIGPVTHSMPVPLGATATDPTLLRASGLTGSDYHGSTGIVSVLGEACREAGLPAISIWAATPHYLAANPNPMAMRALLRGAGAIAGFDGDDTELREMEAEFIERVEEAVQASSELAAYIDELAAEAESDQGESGRIDPGRAPELVDEIEEFLRDV
jgi:predicted ATP-grasp superfamily ATP-dependent carboligase